MRGTGFRSTPRPPSSSTTLPWGRTISKAVLIGSGRPVAFMSTAGFPEEDRLLRSEAVGNRETSVAGRTACRTWGAVLTTPVSDGEAPDLRGDRGDASGKVAPRLSRKYRCGVRQAEKPGPLRSRADLVPGRANPREFGRRCTLREKIVVRSKPGNLYDFPSIPVRGVAG